MYTLSVVVLLIVFLGAEAFTSRSSRVVYGARQRHSRLHEIPLELEGQLNADNKWTVKFIYNGEEKEVEVKRQKQKLQQVQEKDKDTSQVLAEDKGAMKQEQHIETTPAQTPKKINATGESKKKKKSVFTYDPERVCFT